MDWSILGDIAILVVIMITFYWQNHQIKSLKEYINLWRPSEMKKDMDAHVAMLHEIKDQERMQIEEKLQESENKVQDALDIIQALQEKNIHLLGKLIKHKGAEKSDIVEFGTKLDIEEIPGYERWTIRFANGTVKRYKIPRNDPSQKKKHVGYYEPALRSEVDRTPVIEESAEDKNK